MIYKVKKLDRKTYVVVNKLTRAVKARGLTSQSEAQRAAHLLNRELRHLRLREVMQ
jgi:hypothetical protein